ncbi:MAG: hypothetical protein LAO08_18045 [Acidobacteriia bacterium]|nr:hypothetical protein [Terriglobia bacterium]
MPSSWVIAKNKLTELRVQLWIIATAYAGVFVVAAGLLYQRHVWERDHYAEVVASSGMYAAGDTLLWIFIACLIAVPTAFLVWVIAKFESLYTGYSKVLLGLSLTAPFCLIGIFLGEKHVWQNLIVLCFYRFLFSPLILAGIGFSRLVARFGRAKRLSSYALLIEGLTLSVAVALIIHAARSNQH